MSKIVNEPKTIGNEKIDILRNCSKHRANWMANIYLKGREAGLGEEMERFTRAGIAERGHSDGKRLMGISKKGNSCAEMHDNFLAGLPIAAFEVDVKTCTDDVVDLEFHHCPLVTAWQEMGLCDEDIALLCDMAMEGDRNMAEEMGMECELRDLIAKGDPTCQVTFTRKKIIE